jgi:hypothetical protein
MNRFTYTGSLIAVAIGGYGSTASGQEACEQQVEQLQSQVQERELDAQTKQQVEDLLSNARAAGGQECQSIVMEVREQLNTAQSQQTTQVARAESQQGAQSSSRQQSERQQSSQQQTAQQRSAAGEDRTQVQVEQQAADVDVETPAPRVTVQQREPTVTVDQPEPEVTVDQAEPEVTVRQAEPDVEVQQAEPQVEVERAEADVQVRTQETEQRSTRELAQADREQQRQTQTSQISESQASELIGKDLWTRDGEDLGEISAVARSLTDQQLHALVDVGGFLGIGERTVSIPIERAQMDQDGNVIAQMSRDEIEQMPEYDPTQYASIEEEDRVLR